MAIDPKDVITARTETYIASQGLELKDFDMHGVGICEGLSTSVGSSPRERLAKNIDIEGVVKVTDYNCSMSRYDFEAVGTALVRKNTLGSLGHVENSLSDR